ncbi:hypothetical protein [Bradyrhizobium sp. JYMT SZCCT0428]|uniref:hypothetical protein n=1 Tax=Bradyrhizobium sp. JYMT SZCCT0428 TaxID=2807673 RepID=UPI001BA6BA8F|nr:hypothetical protein [Bradyrhizobium sp. JYMT SZCCT0428]MBR1150094.1 hypothetical protein [Bradyrhizobium sp. JYMT SZCCT0428]
MMEKTKTLKISARNPRGMSGVVRQANANFAELYDGLSKLRDDFQTLLARLEHIEARPT